jgi:hypothetical protein
MILDVRLITNLSILIQIFKNIFLISRFLQNIHSRFRLPLTPEEVSETEIFIKKHQHCLLHNDKITLIDCEMPCKFGRPVPVQTKVILKKKESIVRAASANRYKRLKDSRRRKSMWHKQLQQNK